MFSEKSLPFDSKTLFGFAVAAFAQAAGVFCIVCAITPVVGFMFGSCMLMIGFVEDIGSELAPLAMYQGSMKKNRMDMRKRFCYIVDLYSDVKQLSALIILSKNTTINWDLRI